MSIDWSVWGDELDDEEVEGVVAYVARIEVLRERRLQLEHVADAVWPACCDGDAE